MPSNKNQREEYFEYGIKEIDYLKSRDPILAEAIDKIGIIKRGVNPDLFSALVNSIVGQQISSRAQATIWNRITDAIPMITPDSIYALSEEELQSFGISFRKAGYIRDIANSILSGELDIEKLPSLSDEEICKELSKLKGIGVWTAEMIMIFSMQRPDILSYGDLAIIRGLRMLYHHRKITPKLFAKYKRRYSPYASVASLYLWRIASGELPEYKDYKKD